MSMVCLNTVSQRFQILYETDFAAERVFRYMCRFELSVAIVTSANTLYDVRVLCRNTGVCLVNKVAHGLENLKISTRRHSFFERNQCCGKSGPQPL